MHQVHLNSRRLMNILYSSQTLKLSYKHSHFRIKLNIQVTIKPIQ